MRIGVHSESSITLQPFQMQVPKFDIYVVVSETNLWGVWGLSHSPIPNNFAVLEGKNGSKMYLCLHRKNVKRQKVPIRVTYDTPQNLVKLHPWVPLAVPAFPFENKMCFYRQTIMIQCGQPVLLILKSNECKNEMEKQISPPSQK